MIFLALCEFKESSYYPRPGINNISCKEGGKVDFGQTFESCEETHLSVS